MAESSKAATAVAVARTLALALASLAGANFASPPPPPHAGAVVKTFVYELPYTWREGGGFHGHAGECTSKTCAFGHEEHMEANGVGFNVTHSETHMLPWQMYYRMLNSPHR